MPTASPRPSPGPHYACGTALLMIVLAGRAAAGQERSSALRAQPERPTVATHAYTVAPGYVEVEVGGEWDRRPGGGRAILVPLYLKLGIAPRVQLGLLAMPWTPAGESFGMGDATASLKVQLTEAAPLVRDAAVVVGLKLPTGDPQHGSRTTDASLLLVSSRSLGAVGLDLNVGWTWRTGDGSDAPRMASVVTAAAAGPVRGRVSWTAELFAYPQTAGPSGAATQAGLLGGPVIRLAERAVLDAGGIVRLTGEQPRAVYLGVTWNLGRVW